MQRMMYQCQKIYVRHHKMIVEYCRIRWSFERSIITLQCFLTSSQIKLWSNICGNQTSLEIRSPGHAVYMNSIPMNILPVVKNTFLHCELFPKVEPRAASCPPDFHVQPLCSAAASCAKSFRNTSRQEQTPDDEHILRAFQEHLQEHD